jgi:hypothetical protein
MKVTNWPPSTALVDLVGEVKGLRKLASDRRTASFNLFRLREKLRVLRAPSHKSPQILMPKEEAAPYAITERPPVIAD